MLKKKEFKFDLLSEQHQKEVQQVVKLMAAGNKQIFQFPNKSVPALTDLFVISNEANSHQTVNSTLQQVLNTFQDNIEINLAENVTGLLPFSNIQNIASGKLLGRYDEETGEIQEITLGTNLSLVGGVLNAAGDASVTLQDAFDNGNTIDQGATIPYIRKVTTDGQSTFEKISHDVANRVP